MQEPNIQLGERYRDRISGMVGIAVSKTEFLHGCARIALQPAELKDGRPIEPGYFDVYQLEHVDAGLRQELQVETPKTKTGGPGDAVPRQAVPTR